MKTFICIAIWYYQLAVENGFVSDSCTLANVHEGWFVSELANFKAVVELLFELADTDQAVHAAALCSIMAPDCVKVMNTLTTLSEDNKKDPKEILNFVPKRHVLLQRSKFLDCNQTEHDTVDLCC
jgi:hypothetical protein